MTVSATVNRVVTVSQGDAFATKSQKNKPSLRFEYTRQTPLTIDFSTITPARIKTRQEDVLRHSGGGRPADPVRRCSGPPTARPTSASCWPTRLDPAAACATSAAEQQRRDSADRSWRDRRRPGPCGRPWPSAGPTRTTTSSRSTRTTRPPWSSGTAVFGAVPPSGAQIHVTYRVGGGSAGNVPAERDPDHRRRPAAGAARRTGHQSRRRPPAAAIGRASRTPSSRRPPCSARCGAR